jgi:hypothetical protein
MTANVPDPLPNGYHFSRYLIESELSPGELGRVYKAFDTAIKETVALNVLALELRHNEGRWRLIAGLRRARQKPTPQAHEYGEWEGIPFVTVAYIEGVGAAVDVAKE